MVFPFLVSSKEGMARQGTGSFSVVKSTMIFGIQLLEESYVGNEHHTTNLISTMSWFLRFS